MTPHWPRMGTQSSEARPPTLAHRLGTSRNLSDRYNAPPTLASGQENKRRNPVLASAKTTLVPRTLSTPSRGLPCQAEQNPACGGLELGPSSALHPPPRPTPVPCGQMTQACPDMIPSHKSCCEAQGPRDKNAFCCNLDPSHVSSCFTFCVISGGA